MLEQWFRKGGVAATVRWLLLLLELLSSASPAAGIWFGLPPLRLRCEMGSVRCDRTEAAKKFRIEVWLGRFSEQTLVE